jgi:hypothetical protein
MTTELAKIQTNLPATVTDEAFSSLAKGSEYDARLQLFQAGSLECQQGKVPAGNLVLVNRKDSYTVLGTELDFVLLSLRLKAMNIVGEKILNYYDHTLPEFQALRTRAALPGMNGAMCGPEFYIYIPSQKQYATLFCANKTMRTEAPKLRAILNDQKKATIKTKGIKTAKYFWFGFEVLSCSLDLQTPNAEEMMARIDVFNNAKSSEIEAVANDVAGTRER